MIRVTLTEPERTPVQALRRDATLRPAERDRVAMVLLSAAGWTVPAIAQHLGYCAPPGRTMLKPLPPPDLPPPRRQRPGPTRIGRGPSTCWPPSSAAWTSRGPGPR